MRTSCPATGSSKTPRTGRGRALLGPARRAAIRREAGPDGRRDVPRPGDGHGSRRSGSRRPTRWSACPTCTRSGAALAKAELVVVQRRVSPDGDDAGWPTSCCPRPVGREGRGPAPNSERLVVASAEAVSTRRARPCPTGRSSRSFGRGDGLRRASSSATRREVWDEFIGLTDGPAVRHGGHHRRAGCATSGTCNGPARAPTTPAPSAAISTAKFPTPGRPGRLPRRGRTSRPREPTDHEFPFVLTTGRHLRPLAHADAHGQVEQARCRASRRPYVEIHPEDAGRARRSPTGESVQLSSRRGTIRLPVRLRRGHARRGRCSCRSTGATCSARATRVQLPDDRRRSARSRSSRS